MRTSYYFNHVPMRIVTIKLNPSVLLFRSNVKRVLQYTIAMVFFFISLR